VLAIAASKTFFNKLLVPFCSENRSNFEIKVDCLQILRRVLRTSYLQSLTASPPHPKLQFR
jgi:hypothetical protein